MHVKQVRQHAARLLSNAKASSSHSVCLRDSWLTQATQLLRRCKFSTGACFASRQGMAAGLGSVLTEGQVCRLHISFSSSGGLGAATAARVGHRHASRGEVLLPLRLFHGSQQVQMAIPVLIPPAAGLFTVTKIWLLKPAGALLKSLTLGNVIRAARAGSMIRKSWEYKLARRILIASAISAGLLGAVVLVACDFDDAHAAAVIRSIPRTTGAAAWCAHAAWTYKTSLMGYTDVHSPEYLWALEAAHQACAERLVHLCGTNGGIYVKAAQFLASVQTVPAEYRRTLEKLQDQAEPQLFEDTKRAVEREFHRPLEELFAEFDPDARAAASLAQVHKAKLHDGRDVAVKVQYLGLESSVSADLGTLSVLGAIAALVFPNAFEFGWVVERLGKNLSKELDFRVEARNAARLAACMAGNPCVAVPQAVPELSGQRVLTMEWVEGVKLNDRKGMVAQRIRPRDAAKELLKAFAQMIFIHGYVHADPHGGNILVRPRPGPPSWSWWLFGFGWRQPQIVVLDHGLYVDLPEELRQNYCALWCSFLINDRQTATLVSQRIAGERGGKLLPTLLKPGELRSHEQRKEFRREAGVEGLGDIGRLIEGLPEEFLQLLRISAVIRPTAHMNGATNEDRLRINATHAYKGMWKSNDNVPPTLNTLPRRLWMSVSLRGMRSLYWASCVGQDMFDAVMFVPISMAHRMFEARYI